VAKPIKRDAFLYLEPKSDKHRENFAKCSDCMMWTGKEHNVCVIHGPKVKVTGSMSCGLYVEGDPAPDHVEMAKPMVTAKESGLVDRPVRCENCAHAEPEEKECELYEELNESLPALFDLDKKIDPKGCCNANTPVEKSIDALRKRGQMMD